MITLVSEVFDESVIACLKVLPKNDRKKDLLSEYRQFDLDWQRTSPAAVCRRYTRLLGIDHLFNYSKTCLKRNAIVPYFFSVFTGFRFTKSCVLIKQSTKNMIA